MPDSIDVFMVGGPEGDCESCSACAGTGQVWSEDSDLTASPRFILCDCCDGFGWNFIHPSPASDRPQGD